MMSAFFPSINSETVNKYPIYQRTLKFKIGFVGNETSFYEELNKEFDEKKLNDSGLFYFDEKKNFYRLNHFLKFLVLI